MPIWPVLSITLKSPGFGPARGKPCRPLIAAKSRLFASMSDFPVPDCYRFYQEGIAASKIFVFSGLAEIYQKTGY